MDDETEDKFVCAEEAMLFCVVLDLCTPDKHYNASTHSASEHNPEKIKLKGKLQKTGQIDRLVQTRGNQNK